MPSTGGRHCVLLQSEPCMKMRPRTGSKNICSWLLCVQQLSKKAAWKTRQDHPRACASLLLAARGPAQILFFQNPSCAAHSILVPSPGASHRARRGELALSMPTASSIRFYSYMVKIPCIQSSGAALPAKRYSLSACLHGTPTLCHSTEAAAPVACAKHADAELVTIRLSMSAHQ